LVFLWPPCYENEIPAGPDVVTMSELLVLSDPPPLSVSSFPGHQFPSFSVPSASHIYLMAHTHRNIERPTSVIGHAAKEQRATTSAARTGTSKDRCGFCPEEELGQRRLDLCTFCTRLTFIPGLLLCIPDYSYVHLTALMYTWLLLYLVAYKKEAEG
jgi:hypothetical protein